MKNRTKLIATLMVIACLLPCLSACIGNTPDKVVTNYVAFCESTYPYQDGILIANFGTETLDPLNLEGKGYILSHKNGSTSTLIKADGNLSAPKGMCEKDGYLYICDVNKVVSYNLKNLSESPQILVLPRDDIFVNDIAIQGNMLYVSVTNSGRIYRLDISRPEQFRECPRCIWLEVEGPNGLLIDDNSMYIASYPAKGKTTTENIIYKVEDMKNPVAAPFYKVPGQYDGIALSDDKSTLYVSNWEPAGIIAIDINTLHATPIHFDDPLTGPADMTLKDGKLYIPDLPNSRVVIHEL